ncbi:hypothetical protein JMUB7512_27900 [Staphylococcus aureus]
MYKRQAPILEFLITLDHPTAQAHHTAETVSYTHLTLPTNREV